MNARERDEFLDSRAAAIIADSRIAAAIRLIVRHGTASARTARLWLPVQRLARALGARPDSERRVLLLWFVAVAVAGHWLMASMLPSTASPTPALTAVALVAASLAAIAASSRST